MDRNKSIENLYQSYSEAKKVTQELEIEISQHEKEVNRCYKAIERLQHIIKMENSLINQKKAKLEGKLKAKEEITKSAFLSLTDKEENKLKNSVTMAEREAECMICLESCELSDNIATICSRNHWVCSECRKKLKVCPLCKEEIGSTLRESRFAEMAEFEDLENIKQFYSELKTMYCLEAYIGGSECNFVKLKQKDNKIYLEAFEFAQGKVTLISKWNEYVACIEEGENKVLKVFNQNIDTQIATYPLTGEITGLASVGDKLIICFEEGEFNIVRLVNNTLKVESCDFLIEGGIKCVNSTGNSLLIADFEGILYKYSTYLRSSKQRTKPISCIKVQNSSVFTADNTSQIAIWSLKDLNLQKIVELKTCITSQIDLYSSTIIAMTEDNLTTFDMNGTKMMEIPLKEGKFFKILLDCIIVLDLSGTATLFSAKEGTISSKIQYSTCEPISMC